MPHGWQVVDAILADSVRTGRRTGVYTLLYAAGILSLAGGQLIAAGIFAIAGNRRAPQPQRVRLSAGWCFCVPHTRSPPGLDVSSLKSCCWQRMLAVSSTAEGFGTHTASEGTRKGQGRSGEQRPGTGLTAFMPPMRRWTVPLLSMVVLLGQAVAVVPACILFLLDDDHTLGTESEALLVASAVTGGAKPAARRREA